MFTGLIEDVGRVAALELSPGGRRVRIDSALGAHLSPGDSVAVNGVCLTATAVDPSGFSADLSPETLRVTTWGTMAAGRAVNLERPLRADARLGGHFVLGHVDGVGRIAGLEADGDFHWLSVEIPALLLPLVIPKGSIAIDGVSLTIARLDGRRVDVQLVPFTVSHTAFQSGRPGDAVNLEADVLGKYVARLSETAAWSSLTAGERR